MGEGEGGGGKGGGGGGKVASSLAPANVTYAASTQQRKRRPTERYERTWCCAWSELTMGKEATRQVA